MLENLFAWVGFISAIIGIVSIYPTYISIKDRRLQKKQGPYLSIREYVKKNRASLCLKILKEYKYKYYHSKHHLVVKENWIPETPLPINSNMIGFGSIDNSNLVDPSKFISLPLNDSGKKLNNFSEAVKDIDKPTHFSDRQHYRLLDYQTETSPYFTYDTNKASYFDKIDFGNALEYEYGRKAYLNSQKKRTFFGNKLRNKLKNSENILSKIKVLTGISTLTLLQDGNDFRFIMHQRSKVGYAQGVFHVSPAGEFQPESENPEDFYKDFNFWKNIMREYAEEIGMKKEYDGNSGFETDYSSPPFSLMQEAIDNKNAKLYFLGFGLDPLSLQGEVLTICIFKYEEFCKIFPDIRAENEEGIIRTEKEKWGTLFTNDSVETYLKNNTLQAGKAILELTQKHLNTIKF